MRTFSLGVVERVGRAGTFVSLACAVHCVAVPFVAAALPVLGLGFLFSEAAEVLLLASAVLLTAANLSFGVHFHRRWVVCLPFFTGLSLVVAARSAAEGPGEVVLAVAGALGLISAQLLNGRLCRTCPQCGGRHGS